MSFYVVSDMFSWIIGSFYHQDKKKPPVKGKKAKKVTDDDKLYEKEEIASDEGSIIDR